MGDTIEGLLIEFTQLEDERKRIERAQAAIKDRMVRAARGVMHKEAWDRGAKLVIIEVTPTFGLDTQTAADAPKKLQELAQASDEFTSAEVWL